MSYPSNYLPQTFRVKWGSHKSSMKLDLPLHPKELVALGVDENTDFACEIKMDKGKITQLIYSKVKQNG